MLNLVNSEKHAQYFDLRSSGYEQKRIYSDDKSYRQIPLFIDTNYSFDTAIEICGDLKDKFSIYYQ